MPLPPHTGREVALAAVTGALSLVDPAALGPRRRTAYRLACGALTAGFAYAALGPDQEYAARPGRRAALAVGTGTAVLASMRWAERWDARVQGWLTAHGVARPRLVIAAGAAATSLASAFLEPGATVVASSRPARSRTIPS